MPLLPTDLPGANDTPAARVAASALAAAAAAGGAARTEAGESQAERLLERITDCYTLLDRAFRFTALNRAAERTLRRSRAELLGQLLWEAFPATAGSELERQYRRVAAEGVEAHFTHHFEGEGLALQLEVDAYPTDDGGVAIFWRDVSERVRAEAALRASEARYRTLFDSIDEAFCVIEVLFDAAGVAVDFRFLEANAAFARQTGAQAAVGRTAREVFPRLEPWWFERYGRVARTGQPARFEGGSSRVDRWFDVSAFRVGAPGEHRVALLFSEVSERRHAERERERLLAALRTSEERYALAARATGQAIWEWDLVANATIWAEGATAVLGYAELPAAADWWFEAIHPADRERVVAGIHAAAEGPPDVHSWHDTYRFRRGDGTYATIADRGYVVRSAAGRATRMIGAMEDVTARQQLEEQLLHSQKLEAVGQLAGGVAHDFNNLLSVITANVGVVKEEVLPQLPPGSEVREDLEEISQAAERGRTLVRQLLAFSRRQHVQPRHVQLGQLVLGTERLLRRVMGEEVVLEVHAPASGATVHADPGLLEQALVNLALNARDAMLTPRHGHPGTGGALQLEVGEVRLTAADMTSWPELAPGAWVRLRVTDTGCGMDAETRARIFEPFFTTKEVGKGTGLGLSTTFGIVRQAGGAIRVDSAPGKGATFTLLLPAVQAPAHSEPAHPPQPHASPAGRGTVLLVEDEGLVRGSVRRILERQGYRVLEARHGVDALQLWAEQRGEVSLLVTDLRMPEMGGRALAARLRQVRPELPVVFVSGYCEEGSQEALGPREAFVTKPFTSEDLCCAVHRLLPSAPLGAREG